MTTIQISSKVKIDNNTYEANLLEPIDISAPLCSGPNNIHAWYVGDAIFKAVENENWVGDVNRGGAVNFRDVYFNPHGHGTHTECVGHISKENYTINQCLKNFFFVAQLITINPQKVNNDLVITLDQVQQIKLNESLQALVIRTLPNDDSKLNRHYSSQNPPYIDAEAIAYLVNAGINHLLVDLPSLDREHDEGKLAAHHVFWNYPQNTQSHRTITEFVYVPNHVHDNLYLLNLQISSFENDAAPSKPVLFKLTAVL
jgi:kynurenine formamidase